MLATWVLAVSLQLAVVDSARLVDDRLVIEPLGLSLQVPPLWLGRPGPPGLLLCDASPAGTVSDRIRTNRRSLEDLRESHREWKTEYSAVLNTMLPFNTLVAHLGGDPWNGNCGAPHLRIYVRDTTAETVAIAAVRGVHAAEEFFEPVQRFDADSAGWSLTRLSWDAWYYDYGGIATIEFWSRRVRSRIVTFVFMYTPSNDYWTTLKPQILQSVRFWDASDK
jgi:hypothetical protein